jgi:hypothetical protein
MMKGIITCFFLLFEILLCPQTKKTSLLVEIYSEPFDTRGIQSFLYFDIIKRKVKKLTLNVFPIVNKDSNGSFFSSRGDIELTEVARMEGIIERFGLKLNDYLLARSLDISYEGWKNCLIYAQINPLDFDNYLNSNKNKLIENAYNRIKQKNITDFSIIINSNKYVGEVSLIGFIEEVNKYLDDKEKLNLYKKEVQMIKPPQFKIVYNDETKEWIDDNIINSFKRFFPSIVPEKIDINDLSLAEKSKIKMLPVYLIEKTPSVVDLFSGTGGLDEVGNFYAYYNQNFKLLILNKERVSKKLEVFVMSQCPFGVMSLNTLIDAIETQKISKDIHMEIHYIGDVFKDASGNVKFHSLHGDDEWKEDARQIFIKNRFPDKYFSYLKERNKNYSSNQWQEVARSVGIDPDFIEKNFDEAKKLLEKDFEYTNSYGISVSPTFIVDGNIMVIGLSNLKTLSDYKEIEIKNAASGGCGK